LRLGPDAGSEWRRELRLTGRALSFLLGAGGSIAAFQDPDDVEIAARDQQQPWGIDQEAFERAARAIAGTTPVTVSVFGDRESSQAEAPRTLAARANRPLRRVGWDADLAALLDAAKLASRLGAILWLASDALSAEPHLEERTRKFFDRLGAQGPHLILSGRRPIRPLGLMGRRPWLELSARPPALHEVEAFWGVEVPEVEGPTRADIALRYRLSPGEVRAAANVFRSAGGAGDVDPYRRWEPAVESWPMVTSRFSTALVPRTAPIRSRDDRAHHSLDERRSPPPRLPSNADLVGVGFVVPRPLQSLSSTKRHRHTFRDAMCSIPRRGWQIPRRG
jgi:hypothetical protein